MLRSVSFKRFTALLCAMLLIAGMLAGCGGSGDKSASGTTTTTNQTQQKEETKTQDTQKEQQKHVSINFATAGDSNMLEFFNNKINPDFYKEYSNITVNVVGTGAGDAGSRNIYTKLKAQKEAGVEKWDLDAAVVHQSIMGDMIKDDLLAQYVPQSQWKDYVNAANAKNSLGTNVEGYVIPLFNSQTVIAYNPKMVSDPPKSFDELVAWIKANPKKFGYNGVVGGMSGVAFVTAYMYYKTGKYDLYSKGPYDKANESEWQNIIKQLKSLPVTYTQGNAGTLDLLNRGEIAMGPVWVDMFYLWKDEGRMDPEMQIILPSPGMPGQPMYLVIPKKAANPDAALKYVDYVASPKIQAKYVVAENSWYPGIDPEPVFNECSQEVIDKLFSTISAEDITTKGLSFPLAQYLEDLLKAYEEVK